MERVKHVVGLGGCGLIGALLTAHDPIQAAFLGPNEANWFVGAWSGLAFAAYFWLSGQSRSVVRAAVLIVTCAATLLVSLLATAWTALALFGTPAERPLSMLAGGLVGGLLLSMAMFSLYATGRRHLSRMVASTAGGGCLGVVALAVTPALPYRPSFAFFAPVFVLWQTAFGVLIGLLWPLADRAAATRATVTL